MKKFFLPFFACAEASVGRQNMVPSRGGQLTFAISFLVAMISGTLNRLWPAVALAKVGKDALITAMLIGLYEN